MFFAFFAAKNLLTNCRIQGQTTEQCHHTRKARLKARFPGLSPFFPHVPKLQKEFLGQMFFGMLHWNGKRLAEDLAGEIKNASGDVLFSCAYELGHAGHMTIAVGR